MNNLGMTKLIVLLMIAVCAPVRLQAEQQSGDRTLQLTAKSITLVDGRSLSPGPSKENSGIVKSRLWPDLFWMHNDSGDEPRIYAVRKDGSVLLSDRYEVPGTLIGGAINVDWEDITVDNAGHLIVADFGNNGNDRRDLVLYFLHEPAPNAGRTTWFRRVFFCYPDQLKFPAPKEDFNFDAEAIFTINNNVFVLTKHRSDSTTTLYKLDASAVKSDELVTLELVDEFDIRGQATGADATADGKRLVIVTYTAFWLFEVEDPNRPLRGTVTWLPYTGPKQVEAVCFVDEKTLLAADEETGKLFEISLDKFQPAPTVTQ